MRSSPSANRTFPSEPVPQTRDQSAGWFPLLLYFGLALLYFFPAFLPGRHIYGTDYIAGAYFFHEFISERFAAGTLPKWVPYVYGGLPLYANPGSTYYPVRFLADWVFPVSRIWPTLFVVHFTVAGFGTYLLAREIGVRRWAAIVGGLAFQFTGITMSWVLAGHEGRIIVATLTPLVFYFFHRGVRTGAGAHFAGAAGAMGFALLTFQIQSSYYMLLAALVWGVFLLWQFEAFRDRRRATRLALLAVAAVGFAFAMAAVNFLPFMDYVDQSPRGMSGGRGYEYSVSYSMPSAEIAALAVPELSGYLGTYRGTNPFKLHVEYAGATALLLFAVGFGVCRRNAYWWLFGGLGLFALTIALGGNTPIYRIYYEVFPGFKRFRAPSISFFLVSFSIVMMATIALEALAARFGDEDRSRLRDGISPLGWRMLGVVGLALLLGIAAANGGSAEVPGPGPLAFRFALFTAITGALLWAWVRGSLRTTAFAVALSVITVVDLWVVARGFFQTVEPPEVMFAADDVADFLRARPGRDRVWVLPFPPQGVYRAEAVNYLMHYDVDQAGGEHGNQLQRYNQFVGAGEETYVDWHNFLENPAFLNAGNVRYIVSGMEFQDPRLREVHRGSALIYENLSALPRAYLVPEVVTVGEEGGALERMRQAGFDPARTAVVNSPRPVDLPSGELQGSATITSYDPDRVEVRTEQNRAALLVLADNYYADWRVRVDGRPAEVLRTNHTFRGVVVPAGAHTVTFSFEPADLRTGLYIYLVCLALLALVVVFSIWKRVRTAPAAG